MMPEIVFQDERYVAINKPHGLLTHPSSIAMDADVTALQMLRDYLGQYVYPSHRLDRKTGGVLLFALDKETHKITQKMFAENGFLKEYWAIVRGFTEDEAIIEYPIKTDTGKVKDAVTLYKTLQKSEIDVPFGKHPTSRYSLVLAGPKTGRMHQLRMHFSHILHPIIGDRPHGCNKQNRFFKEKWQMTTMLLHAKRLSFVHPFTKKQIDIEASLQPEFIRVMKILNFNIDLNET